MKRALIQLDEDTHRRLRQRAFKERRSIAAVVRDMVAVGLDADPDRPRPVRLQQMASVRAGRSRSGRGAVSEQHDAALVEAFEK